MAPMGRFNQQRNIKNQAACMGRCGQTLNFCTNEGMDNGFEYPTGFWLGKHMIAHTLAVQAAIRTDKVSSKCVNNG